jgi:hypothetical protein
MCACPVLSLVNEERNGYGLRSNEYSRYQYAMILLYLLTRSIVDIHFPRSVHCSRKVQRLRQNLRLPYGKGREFKQTPPVAKENLVNAQYVLYRCHTTLL